MNTILTVISEQWIFILMSVVLIAALYIVKSKKPQEFKRFAYIELVATAAALVVFALFHFSDLFLLAPIILICFELFGYVITGRVVGVILVDYLLIRGIYALSQNGIINSLFETILFYALQIAAAIAIGVLIDNFIRMLNKEKKREINSEKEKEEFQRERLEHVDDIVSKHSDNVELAQTESSDDEDLTEEEINEILNKYSNLNATENEIFSSADTDEN